MNKIPDLFQNLALPWTDLPFFLSLSLCVFSLCLSLYSFILRPQECFFLSESCKVLILGSGCVYTCGFCLSLNSPSFPYSVFLHFLLSLQNLLSSMTITQMTQTQMNLNAHHSPSSKPCPVNLCLVYVLANFAASYL